MSDKPKDYQYRCKVTSNYPEFELNWALDLQDEDEFVYYSNLAADLTAAVHVKLGQEFSKWRLDNDSDRLKHATNEMIKALGGSILE